MDGSISDDREFIEEYPIIGKKDAEDFCGHCDLYGSCSQEMRSRNVAEDFCPSSIYMGIRLDYVTLDIVVLGGTEYIRPGLKSSDGISLIRAVTMRL